MVGWVMVLVDASRLTAQRVSDVRLPTERVVVAAPWIKSPFLLWGFPYYCRVDVVGLARSKQALP
jgi:hypothetical protein